jgi:pimeloyl-ACP methyl ester carboxylesterase
MHTAVRKTVILFIFIINTLVLSISLIVLINNTIEMKSEGTFFYTETEGSKMPVWVCGNTKSKIFIVYLAGGPGSSCLLEHFSVPMKELEKKYRVVYFDQRNSGRAEGKFVKGKITLNQFVKDTDHIINTINQKYDNPSIIIMGHGWGGTLGTAYLLDQVHQQKIKGWIEIDGGHNQAGFEKESRLYALNYAYQHRDEKKWEKALAWYNHNPVITKDTVIQHTAYLQAAHAYTPEGESGAGAYTISIPKMLFSYNYNIINSNYRTYKLIQVMDTFRINMTGDMYKIKIPVLIIWGKDDNRVSKQFGYEAYNAIGSVSRKIVILPHSGHFPTASDFPLFTRSIDNFIKYNL